MAAETKQNRSVVRIAVDAALAVLFVAVMATALVQEAPHEYLGIAVFAAVVAHVVLNRRWFKALARGRYNAVRVLRLVAVVGLLACVVGQVASSVVLSKYAFRFLPALPGASWARRVHMLCSYWGFVFAFAHAGLQFKGLGRMVRASRHDGSMPTAALWAARIALVAVACFGAYSFAQANMGAYLLGQVQFAFADSSESLALAFARYASMAVLVAGAFHYLRRAIEAASRPKGSTGGRGEGEIPAAK